MQSSDIPVYIEKKSY